MAAYAVHSIYNCSVYFSYFMQKMLLCIVSCCFSLKSMHSERFIVLNLLILCVRYEQRILIQISFHLICPFPQCIKTNRKNKCMQLVAESYNIECGFFVSPERRFELRLCKFNNNQTSKVVSRLLCLFQ